MIIRQVIPSDAPLLIAFTQALDSQTPFMLREPGERQINLEQQKTIIQNTLKSPVSTMFVVYDPQRNEIVGICSGVGSPLNKKKHCVHCIIGVLEEFQGQGYGKQLLKKLEVWAKTQNIRRLELTVMEHNYRAINLYDSLGFTAEGLKKDSIRLNGKFVNEIYMCKLLP